MTNQQDATEDSEEKKETIEEERKPTLAEDLIRLEQEKINEEEKEKVVIRVIDLFE